MKEYIFECNGCGDVRKMIAANPTVTINHANCGIYKYSSEVTNNSKTSGTRASKPPKSLPVESNLVVPKSKEGQEYFHPKIRLVETYRCPTCFKKNECNLTFEEKTWCLIKFLFNTNNTSNPTVEGVLSKDPSSFEIIELDDINQKINSYDIVRLFINRDDKYSRQEIDINDPTKDKFPDINEILTYEILIKSLKGRMTIGTRPINPNNNKIKYICWDIDKEHNGNPGAVVDALVKYLKEWYELTGYIELSGSIDSYHVWVFIIPIDNTIAYNFDQNFRTRLKSIGIGTNHNSIERGVQLGDGGMTKLPYNYQMKEKYGHKGRRSRFFDGVDLSKIIPERLPEPWGISQSSEINTLVPVNEEKTDPEINISQPMAEEKTKPQELNKIFNDILKNNEKVDGKLKCDKCPNVKLITQININEIINGIKYPHNGCGGKISFGIAFYETSVEILKMNTERVKNFCEGLMESPKKRTEFDYDIRPTSNNMFENRLILKTKTEKAGKELAGWLANCDALMGKLHQPAPTPFKVQKVTDFSFDFTRVT